MSRSSLMTLSGLTRGEVSVLRGLAARMGVALPSLDLRAANLLPR